DEVRNLKRFRNDYYSAICHRHFERTEADADGKFVIELSRTRSFVIARSGRTRCAMLPKSRQTIAVEKIWLRGLDLNQRPSGYEPDELPGCSTPRDENTWDIILRKSKTVPT